jgi:hypothetical protein
VRLRILQLIWRSRFIAVLEDAADWKMLCRAMFLGHVLSVLCFMTDGCLLFGYSIFLYFVLLIVCKGM